jgi:CheY-like chemotaxis protein
MPHTYLVVSDGELFRLIQDLLGSERRALFHASTGGGALHLLANWRSPTVVLLDLPLADMSGSEFIESVRDDSELSCMVATVCLAGAGVRIPQRAFRVVRKPSIARELLGAIKDARRQLARSGAFFTQSAAGG